MKVLLINNHTDYLHNVVNALNGHQIEIQKYKPGLDFHWQGKDLVVLSGGGGEGYELKDKRGGKLWYDDEIKFVQTCPVPLIGVCMGFEVIGAAFGSEVKHLAEGLITGFKPVRLNGSGARQVGHPKLEQFEYHQFGIDKVESAELEVLADSGYGIEMFKHKKRKIAATQFHPEVQGGTIGLDHLIAQVV